MKVFVTVGSMLPFDRLVRAADIAASELGDRAEFVAQIGDSNYRPQHMTAEKMLTPEQFRRRVEWSDVIVSHVGMGTVITASDCRKKLIAIPRRPELSEVTSAHQIATARWLRDRNGVVIIEDESLIRRELEQLDSSATTELTDSGTRKNLISAVRDFVFRDLEPK
jgi:UDP-N-acetylglucosamine transferase subunit ALG13